MVWSRPLAVIAFLAASCSQPDGSDGSDGSLDCDHAAVTDIDETLTVSNEEWDAQLADGRYDPREREYASELIQAYFDRGYVIVYLTARARTRVLGVTGESATEATERWLQEHGFPRDPDLTHLFLAPEPVSGDEVRAYKSGALRALEDEGFMLDFAYGNALTDIAAYEEAGISKSVTFIIGEHAGADGTVAIDEEGWIDHAQAHLPTVGLVCGATAGTGR